MTDEQHATPAPSPNEPALPTPEQPGAAPAASSHAASVGSPAATPAAATPPAATPPSAPIASEAPRPAPPAAALAARDTEVTGYVEPIRLLHWAVAGLLVLQFLIAWTMPDVHRGTRPTGLIAWHLAIGTLILLLMVVRLGYRWTTPKPPPPSDLSLPTQLLSRANHVILYVVLLALPVMGWINASSRGWRVYLAGIIPLPRISPNGSSAGIMMGDLHAALAWVLLIVIAFHLAGAANHLLLRDGVIDRIVPERFRRKAA